MKQVLLALILIAVPVTAFSGFRLFTAAPLTATSSLGDLSTFQAIVADVSAIADTGDLSAARTRIKDFESAWDQAETALRPLNGDAWDVIDRAADHALKALRTATPVPADVKASLAALSAALDNPYAASAP